ncbi:MAG: hypothetical protein VB022_11205 [Rikenellaceae bacterium]|nr:hypothetical protein [Rikenellaceae bacterium]
MARYEIGFRRGKTDIETYWKVWLWAKGSENNILGLLGKLFRKFFLKK